MSRYSRSVKVAGKAKRLNRKDGTGSVQVRVVLGGGRAKGNITRSLTVADEKVSTVFAAVERALFGGRG